MLERDQPGLDFLLHLRRFFIDIMNFSELRSAPQLIVSGEDGLGHRPSVLAAEGAERVAVYLPVGGEVTLRLPEAEREERWFDPRTGELQPAEARVEGDRRTYAAPAGGGERPWDWVLISAAREGPGR